MPNLPPTSIMDFLSLIDDLGASEVVASDVGGVGSKRDRSVGTTTAAHAVVVRAPPIVLSPDIKVRLFDHQVEGVNWLCERHRAGCGCILADEMGLGKTVQVAVFLGEAMRAGAIKTVVVVVPPTLVPMWEKCFQEWAGLGAPIVSTIHKGSKASREKQWARLRHGVNAVVITTYGIVKSDIPVAERYAADYVVLDEAHAIKDPATDTFKAVVRLQAVHRIAMTGTPLMNSFNDLWALMQFADSRILACSRADFSRSNAAITRGNERDAEQLERGAAEAQLSHLQQLIAPFILRRLKSDTVGCSIAEKSELVLWLRMQDGQEDQYRSFLASDVVRVALREIDTSNPLVLLTSLKKICDHPWLNFNQTNFAKALLTPFNAPQGFEDFGTIESPKLMVALALVRAHLAEGRKTLLFSRSKKLLDMMGLFLIAHNLKYCRIDGDTPSEDRCRIADNFNRDPEVGVCLLTTQVGGVGITFSGASRVVMLDPSWNPAVDAQAVDRVHRIGQTDAVVVYRLIMAGSVDEMVYRNQIFKMMASKQAMMGASDRALLHRYFTHTQLKNMFELGDTHRSVTAEHVESIHPDAVPKGVADALKGDLGDLVVGVSSHTAMFCPTQARDDAPIAPEPKVQRRRRKNAGEKVDGGTQPDMSQPEMSPVREEVIESPAPHLETIPAIPLPRPLPRCSIFDQGMLLDEDDARDARQLFRGVSFGKLKMSAIYRQSVDVAPGTHMLDSCSLDDDDGSLAASDVADEVSDVADDEGGGMPTGRPAVQLDDDPESPLSRQKI